MRIAGLGYRLHSLYCCRLWEAANEKNRKVEKRAGWSGHSSTHIPTVRVTSGSQSNSRRIVTEDRYLALAHRVCWISDRRVRGVPVHHRNP
jgi:hypothetical protein